MGVHSLGDIVVVELRDIQSTQYAELASSAIIIYDHIVTLADEIELIWKAKWSMGTIIFILNRYYGLFTVIFNNYGFFSPMVTDSVSSTSSYALCMIADNMSSHRQVVSYDRVFPSTCISYFLSCTSFFAWQGWTGLVAFMLAEVILQMRLYALYFFNKKILALMLGGFLVCSAGAAYVMGYVLTGLTITSHPVTGVTFCTPVTISSHFYAFWIPMLAFETLLCALAVFRGYQTFKSSSSRFQSGRHLVEILVRDSVLYFLVMFATYLTNLLIFIFARTSLLEIPIGFSVAMSCVMGNRMVLNVRDVNRTRNSQANSRSPLHKESSIVMAPYLSSRRSKGCFDQSEVLTEGDITELRTMRADHGTGHIVMV